jgi:hypothetical protein
MALSLRGLRVLFPPSHFSFSQWEMEDSSGWKRIEGDFGKF